MFTARHLFAAFAGLLLTSNLAYATPPEPEPAPEGAIPAQNPTEVDFMGSLATREALLGEMGGLRPWLDTYGVTVNLTETSEYIRNVSGGARQDGAYDGLTTLTLQLDTKKAFNWEGGLFNVTGFEIHGRNLSKKGLNSLQIPSGIEGDNGARLWEIWYQQSFYNDKIDVRIGQQSIDTEYAVSSNALLFMNTAEGWPMASSSNLLSGGPAYPISSPGIRLRAKLDDRFTALAGVYNDNPSDILPGSSLDPQRLNDRGTNFRLSDDPLVIAELQFARPGAGDDKNKAGKDILPGTYRIGAWFDFGKFADQEYGTDGLSLANPGSNGISKKRRGNYNIYAVIDQMVWRPDVESGKGLSVFARAMGVPADRNLVNFSFNGGLTYKGLIPTRDSDTIGITYGIVSISNSLSSLDRQNNTFPIRSHEQFIEATYQMQLLPWIQLQPDVQYVINPGAGLANPRDANSRMGDELIYAIRTNIVF